MLTPIGQMREIVAVLSPTTTVDESGGEVTTYKQSPSANAAVRSVSTKEAVQFGQINAEVTHVLFGHWYDFHATPPEAKIRDLETDEEYEIIGGPINDSKKGWTRLNLVRRFNG